MGTDGVSEQGQAEEQATGGQAPRKPPLEAGLHIVATPIGNMGDITLRALDILRAADLIACEDTRVFAKLASHYGIAVPTVAYSDATQEAAEPRIVRALASGKRVALVSDAGMPLISDPGYRLVRAALAGGYKVSSAPGASAVPMALALSGLPTDRFFFAGFLPAKPTERRRAIGEAGSVPSTLVFFEAPHRLACDERRFDFRARFALRAGLLIDALDEDLGPHFFPARADGTDPRGCPACSGGRH